MEGDLCALLREWLDTPYFENREEYEAWLDDFRPRVVAALHDTDHEGPQPEGGEEEFVRAWYRERRDRIHEGACLELYRAARRSGAREIEAERDALRSRVEELEAGLKSMVVQFAYWSEKDGGGLWCGGLSALEEAFDLLGFNGFWKRNDLACQFEGCSERADCGTPQDDGPYLWLCQKHYCYVVDTGNVRLKAALGGGTGGV